ncbi:MAG TPA: exosortase F system-associated protein [Cyclobacteriaceae bacterium]|nr:exosortase F system-associated protein [Cyclobacteriaceae bacterium]HMV08956.1 exosortase F system-associated protein [Cyclobacteriaceae bacterium]HMV90151.1 exosortase F system-associated protein [Cyclobacteriaceae bacterium]HMX00289.1 exosortase F system-associated protein [Cyclobacteriaceae bacterium]HMX49712.1 exosortase F system-associated protein [Cyclobacteriaceae bacterium]
MRQPDPNVLLRSMIGAAGVLGLLLVFLFQNINAASFVMPDAKPIVQFLINRSIRFFLNDLFAILLIYALFPVRQYVVFALWTQLFGTVFILLPYFVLKLNFPSYNGPLLSFLHRLILNPTLILLLIPAFYYQRSTHHKS